MPTYIAFLRGINVGNIRIKMPDLKTAFEKMGHTGVKTYLQTGNVVFDAESGELSQLKAALEQTLSATFRYEAFVLLYPFSVLPAVVAGYPMERGETHHAYVVFIENENVFSELKSFWETLPATSERVVAGDGVMYWRVERGDSTETPFAKLLAKPKYKSTTTVRNINTLEKML
jgi:uncharacterized protein (DUF1697 family)